MMTWNPGDKRYKKLSNTIWGQSGICTEKIELDLASSKPLMILRPLAPIYNKTSLEWIKGRVALEWNTMVVMSFLLNVMSPNSF